MPAKDSVQGKEPSLPKSQPAPAGEMMDVGLQSGLGEAVQRSFGDPRQMRPRDVVQLQRTVGNVATLQQIQRVKKPTAVGETEKAKAENLRALDADQDRVQAVLALLDSGKASFEKLAELLYGIQFEGREEFKAALLTRIRIAITHPWKQKYLVGLIENKGQPKLVDKLAVALGLISHSSAGAWLVRPGDPDEFLRILEGSDWEKEPGGLPELMAFLENPEVMPWLSRFERARSAIQKRIQAFRARIQSRLPAPEVPADDPSGLVSVVEVIPPPVSPETDPAVAHLLTIIEQFAGGVGKVDAHRLFDEVKGWCKQASAEFRLQAARPEGAVDLKLRSYRTLKARDRVHLLNLIRGGLDAGDRQIGKKLGLGLEDLRKPKSAWKEELKAQEGLPGQSPIRDKQSRAGNVDALAEMDSLLEREKEKRKGRFTRQHGFAGRFRDHHSRIKAHVDSMTDDQREQFLITRLPVDEAQRYWDPTLDQEAKKVLFEKALQAFKGELVADKVMKEKEVADMIARFQFKGELGGAYRQLVRLVARKESGQMGKRKMEHSFAYQALGLAARLKGNELGQVRLDKELWGKLKELLKDEAEGPKFLKVFGLADWESALEGDKPDDQVKKAVSEAESSPLHWAELINRRFEAHWRATGLATVPWGQLAGIVRQAQSAARQKAGIPLGKLHAGLTRELVEAAQGFMDEVHANLTDNVKGRIKGSIVETGLKDWRRYITPDWIIDHSSIGKNRKSEVIALFENASPTDLLEWSNFQDFERLWNAWMASRSLVRRPAVDGDGAGPAEAPPLSEDAVAQERAAKAALDGFVFDLRPSIIRRIEKHYGSITGQRTKPMVEVLGKARRKLAGALVKEKLVSKIGGLQGDPEDYKIMKERLEALCALDEAELRRRGIQWGGLSVKSQLDKEAIWGVKGAHRRMGAKLEPAGGMVSAPDLSHEATEDRHKVIDDSVTEMGTLREELERRGGAFEAMRQKYNDRVKLTVELMLTAAIAAGTGPLAAAPMLTQMLVGVALKTAQSVAMKLLDFGLKGHVDLTSKESLYFVLGETVKASMSLSAATAYAGTGSVADILKAAVDKSPAAEKIAVGIGSKMISTAFDKTLQETGTRFVQEVLTKETAYEQFRKNPHGATAGYMRELLEFMLQSLVKTSANDIVKGTAFKDAKTGRDMYLSRVGLADGQRALQQGFTELSAQVTAAMAGSGVKGKAKSQPKLGLAERTLKVSSEFDACRQKLGRAGAPPEGLAGKDAELGAALLQLQHAVLNVSTDPTTLKTAEERLAQFEKDLAAFKKEIGQAGPAATRPAALEPSAPPMPVVATDSGTVPSAPPLPVEGEPESQPLVRQELLARIEDAIGTAQTLGGRVERKLAEAGPGNPMVPALQETIRKIEYHFNFARRMFDDLESSQAAEVVMRVQSFIDDLEFNLGAVAEEFQQILQQGEFDHERDVAAQLRGLPPVPTQEPGAAASSHASKNRIREKVAV